MSTKRIVFRQHIRGSESALKKDLTLSLGEQEISYRIILDEASDHLMIVDENEQAKAKEGRGCAKIHTQKGCVCVEALSQIVKVESLPLSFDGTSFNGIMSLQVSDPEKRIYYQLHPGATFFVGSHTISIVPEEYRDNHDSFRELLSQHVSEQQCSSRYFDTPVDGRVRSTLSSPTQATPLTKQALALDRQGWSPGPVRRSLLGIIRDVSKTHTSENSDSLRREISIQKDGIDLAVDTFATTCEEKTGKVVDLQNNDRADEVISNDQMRDCYVIEGSESARRTMIEADFPRRRKRRRLTAWASSSPREETQDSMKSNIIVQRPTHRLVEERYQTHDDEPSSGVVGDRSSKQGTTSSSNTELSLLEASHTNVRVLFTSSTSIDDSKPFMKFLEKQGVKRVSSVADCTALCVSKSSELKKTSKLIMAVLQGKVVITDDWVTQSVAAGKLLAVTDFNASDPKREAEWAIDLHKAIERGKNAIPRPFDGWTVAFTPAAKKDAGTNGFKELKEIALLAGAKNCSAMLPKKSPEESKLTLIIACPNDPASATLKGSWRLFSRDLIGLSCLRGKVDVGSDEFLVRSESKIPKGSIKNKRKS